MAKGLITCARLMTLAVLLYGMDNQIYTYLNGILGGMSSNANAQSYPRCRCTTRMVA